MSSTTNKQILQALKDALPELFTEENKLDLQKFKTAFESEIHATETSTKKYGLVWEDKPEQFETDSLGKFPVITKNETKSFTLDATKPTHILIQGDNYHALKVLNYTHERSVDVIYIDPPYNTGNGDFTYNDRIVDAKDGFKHSKWLSFMNKRLLLAKSLLKSTGFIAVSIGRDEFYNLVSLMNSIFNEKNLVETFAIKTANQTEDQYHLACHDYLLVYRASDQATLNGGNLKVQEARCTTGKITQTQPELLFPKGLRVAGVADGKLSIAKTGGLEDVSLISGIIEIEDGKLKNDIVLKARWSCPNDIKNYVKWFKGLSSERPINKFGKPLVELYLKGARLTPFLIKEGKELLPSIIDDCSNPGSADLKKLEMDKLFDYPKSVVFIKKILANLAPQKGVVLDFFAGSGTTGQAVAELNEEDGGTRTCILVTNDEGEFKDSTGAILEGGICTHVTYPRMQKVLKGYTNSKGESVAPLGENLAFFKTEFVAESNDHLGRKSLVSKSCEILALSENTLKKSSSEDNAFISFSNELSTKRTLVLFEYTEYDRLLPLIYGNLDIECVIYVFVDDGDILSIPELESLDNVTLKKAPSPITRLYKSLEKGGSL